MKLTNFLLKMHITTVFVAIAPLVAHNYRVFPSSHAWETSNVQCYRELIQVDVLLAGTDWTWSPQPSTVYLENTRNDPLKRCLPLLHSKGFAFKIPLNESYKCGFTRVVNKLTYHTTYHQNLILETNDRKKKFPINCAYRSTKLQRTNSNHKIVKRESLPDGFQEDDDIEIVDTLQQTAPVPNIAMEVRQNGQLIDGMVTVIPGTPLIMDIKLDDVASKTYGLNIKYLEVSDGKDTSETIVFRGCTVDPYLFENFIVTANNTMQAKFRAFKFPNTAFVQFRANVQICLRKCLIAHCLSGQGRRRRELDVQHMYEVSLGLLMKIDGFNKDNEEEIRKVEEHVKLLKMKRISR